MSGEKMTQRRYQIRKIFRNLLLAAGCVGVFSLCSGCGETEDFEVSILDGQYETVIGVSSGETVASVLERAEITLGDDDVVTPEADDQIQDGDESITIERSATVTVSDGTVETEIALTGGKVGDALEAVEITLGENDLINHETAAYLTDGMSIEVERRYGVTITANGESEYIVTQASTVDELLEEEGIELSEEDRITPERTTALADGTEIEIQYVTKKQVVEEEEIAYETVYENSSSLYSGQTSVKQEGQNGIKELTYEVTYVDGEEESRELISEEVTKEAVNEIILKGTKQKQSSSSSSGSSSSSSSSGSSSSGKTVVSKEAVYDCDGSGHGYYIITYSDGSVEYKDF
ncbi:MAG: G5 domain-containing protein [Clostridiales bacterium]|nr:G5 domain-containing protein [Clostridiales bacterium]